MRRSTKGSFTVEAALVVPLVLVVVSVLLHILFYYHDKNILTSAAHATAVYGCSRELPGERQMKEYFEERVKNRCMLFGDVQQETVFEKDRVTVSCRAKHNIMSIKTECSIEKTDPEDFIRGIRKIKKIGERIEK